MLDHPWIKGMVIHYQNNLAPSNPQKSLFLLSGGHRIKDKQLE